MGAAKGAGAMLRRLSAGVGMALVAVTAASAGESRPAVDIPYSDIILGVHRDFGPKRRWSIEAQWPEFRDPHEPGTIAFTKAMRDFVDTEIAALRDDAQALPEEIQSEVNIVGQPFFPGAGLISVQFKAEGVMANGFVYTKAVTYDLTLRRAWTLGDVFSGNGWRDVAAGQCRKALADRTDAADICAGPELADIGAWQFGSDQARVSLLLPGKELRDIWIVYSDLAGFLVPGFPLKH